MFLNIELKALKMERKGLGSEYATIYNIQQEDYDPDICKKLPCL